MKIEEIKPRASEGDFIELEGKVSHAQKPNEGQYGWSQFIGVKDSTGEQNCWIKLEGEEDKVTKGTPIKIKGKLSAEYPDKKTKEMVRSINNCDFEVIGKVQASAQSSQGNGNGTKDNYWEKKFEWEVKKDKRVQYLIVRQCAIKCATELAVAKIAKGNKGDFLKDKIYFECADGIVDWVYKKVANEDLRKEVIEELQEDVKTIKEEKIKKAREVVGKTEFKPASTKQKNIIFGYRDKDGWHKGIIESRYIEKHEIKKIGDPKKLSVEKASKWIEFWWGDQFDPDDIGARKQREIDNPRDENGKLVGALIKGDKTSLVKDILIDEINALRRENFLSDEVKFREELGYNSDFEELTEKELKTLKDLLKNFHPKDWDEK